MESWLFRQDKRSERLEELGDRLEFLQTLIPWEEWWRNVSHFGYKTNVCVDVGSKFFRNFCVCPANEHESRHFVELLDTKSRFRNVYADSAYVGQTHEDRLTAMDFSPQICERP